MDPYPEDPPDNPPDAPIVMTSEFLKVLSDPFNGTRAVLDIKSLRKHAGGKHSKRIAIKDPNDEYGRVLKYVIETKLELRVVANWPDPVEDYEERYCDFFKDAIWEFDKNDGDQGGGGRSTGGNQNRSSSSGSGYQNNKDNYKRHSEFEEEDDGTVVPICRNKSCKRHAQWQNFGGGYATHCCLDCKNNRGEKHSDGCRCPKFKPSKESKRQDDVRAHGFVAHGSKLLAHSSSLWAPRSWLKSPGSWHLA